MKSYTVLVSAILFFLLLSIYPDSLSAAPYYEGKVISIVVGTSPGGGNDRLARVLAKHLPKYIPGKPTVLVVNMPGADGMIAANHLYNIAKPDGLTIGTISNALPFAQLLKSEGARFDVNKFSWIGSMATEETILTIRSDLPYKTFDDLKKEKAKEPIPLACTGPGYKDYPFVTLLNEFVGLNLKLIIYTASAEAMLAIERKEADGRAGSYSSLKPFIDRGLIRPLIRGRRSEPEIKDLPVNEDLTTDPKGKAIMAMLNSADEIGRPYVAPPGTPTDIMNILRDAFDKVAKDPELKEDAKKNKLEITYLPADDCLKVLNNLFNQPSDIVKEFGKHVKY